MEIKKVLAAGALVAGAAAQVASYSSNGFAISVNVPSDTASSGSGSIYFQISCPSGTEWVSFGQGTQMSGSQMFVMYAADSSSVTVSPRLGTGRTMPQFNSAAQIEVLEGSGVASDGSLVANVRCDSCLSWSGGSMDATSTSSNWIWAYKAGSPLDSADTSASISVHDDHGAFTLDLTTGTGGSSSNPFVAAAGGDSSESASASETASETGSVTATGTETATTTGPRETINFATMTDVATSTGGVSNPVASSDSSSNSNSASTVQDPTLTTRIAHGVIMSLVFVLMFPLAALTIYLSFAQKVRLIHAPLQVVSIILSLVGLGLGIKLGQDISMLSGYHQVIGYITMAWLAIAQPALGLGQHLHFRKYGTRSPMGSTHRWLGRVMIALGIVNGGLGFMQTGPVGSRYVPNSAVVAYSVITVLVFLVYIAVVFILPTFSSKKSGGSGFPEEKRPNTEGYEMRGHSFESTRNLRG